MITPDSRYQDAAKTFTVGHTYDEFGRIYLNGDEPTPVARTVSHETLFRLTTPSPPQVSPVEYMAKSGESMSFIAWKMTSAHSNWWKVAESNPAVWYPLDLTPGTALKVPI
jgi:hypothetical protein